MMFGSPFFFFFYDAVLFRHNIRSRFALVVEMPYVRAIFPPHPLEDAPLAFFFKTPEGHDVFSFLR